MRLLHCSVCQHESLDLRALSVVTPIEVRPMSFRGESRYSELALAFIGSSSPSAPMASWSFSFMAESYRQTTMRPK